MAIFKSYFDRTGYKKHIPSCGAGLVAHHVVKVKKHSLAQFIAALLGQALYGRGCWPFGANKLTPKMLKEIELVVFLHG